MLTDPTEGSIEDGIIHTTKKMKSQYKIQGIPVVYLIDSQGIIKHVHVGFKEKDIQDIENTINKIMTGQTPPGLQSFCIQDAPAPDRFIQIIYIIRAALIVDDRLEGIACYFADYCRKVHHNFWRA